MENAHLLSSGLGFLLGLLLCGGLSLVWVSRIRSTHADAIQKISVEHRERTESQIEKMRSRLELEFEKRKLELDHQVSEQRLELKSKEEELASTKSQVENELAVAEKRRLELDERVDEVGQRENHSRALAEKYRSALQEISKVSESEARSRMIEEVHRDCEAELRVMKGEMLQRSEKEVEAEARRILIDSMQRLSAAPHVDITATIVSIPSEDMKGRIIGREGRNIKSFESLTGTTLLIDETPDSVLVSSFDPVRREIARIALESLIRDGRIHPTSIEEAVNKAEDDVKRSVQESGEDALRRLKLGRMHPEVLKLVGKLRFRLSYNQNALEHSIEVANLCALMAAELGLDPQLAKRCGLLHDIGKALDQDNEGSHAVAGSYFLKRYGEEDSRVINAVGAHHGEVESESPYVALVMIADSLSAMRPGARSESVDGYIQRVRNLEEIARSMDGIVEAYAIQAGREVRVIVSPDQVSEANAPLIARQIRRRIEDELQYPGMIKVTVIREQRFQEVAK